MTTRQSKGYSATDLETRLLGRSFRFGDAIEGLRALYEFSQAELARKMGISRQYLCDVEKGRRTVSLEQAVRFAKAFRHPHEVLVKLAIQDQVNEAGLKMVVEVRKAG